MGESRWFTSRGRPFKLIPEIMPILGSCGPCSAAVHYNIQPAQTPNSDSPPALVPIHPSGFLTEFVMLGKVYDASLDFMNCAPILAVYSAILQVDFRNLRPSTPEMFKQLLVPSALVVVLLALSQPANAGWWDDFTSSVQEKMSDGMSYLRNSLQAAKAVGAKLDQAQAVIDDPDTPDKIGAWFKEVGVWLMQLVSQKF